MLEIELVPGKYATRVKQIIINEDGSATLLVCATTMNGLNGETFAVSIRDPRRDEDENDTCPDS